MKRRNFLALVGASAAGLSACGGGYLRWKTPEAEFPLALPALFDDIEKRTFEFFWDTTNPENGLAPDRFPEAPFCSVAAVGFALTSYPIGVEQAWITRAQAAQRTLATLKFLHNLKSGEQATGVAGHRGFFYHFLDLQTGHREGDWVELSSVDTGLLLMGALFAQSYFDRQDPNERKIRALAESLYRRVQWPWLQVRSPLLSMGWFPEKGFLEHDWVGYNEAMLVYVLALGSPSYPVQSNAWQAWTVSYARTWGTFQGQQHLGFAPHFGHQYSHCWIDFRGIQDAYMRAVGSSYFENSRRASYAQQRYASENSMRWKGYSDLVWGLSACDGPQAAFHPYLGDQREFRGYSARGVAIVDSFDDGTLAPTAALASLPFAPELVIPTTHALHRQFGEHGYGRYGFLDAFNPSFEYPGKLLTGKIVPEQGWFASDYLGIDQGPILAMIANYRSDFIWRVMRKNPHIVRGLQRAGFKGGWLDG